MQIQEAQDDFHRTDLEGNYSEGGEIGPAPAEDKHRVMEATDDNYEKAAEEMGES